MFNNMLKLMREVCFLFVLMMLVGCAPSARYFNVDVKNGEYVDLPLEGKKVAVFSITTQSKADSIRCGKVALGVAEKIEEDRGMLSGEIPVYSVPKIEFRGFPSGFNNEIKSVDTTYLNSLMLNSGAQVLLFVDNLRFGQYSVKRGVTSNEYDNANVVIPYFVDFNAYDSFADSLLLKIEMKDSVYMQLVSGSAMDGNVGGVIAGYLPEIAKKIGAKLGSYLSVQWETQERMLITFEGDSSWESAVLMAQDFKWQDAINAWMKLAESDNVKKSAYAAYNIAVGCEMLEQFDLARQWLEFSLKKFKFRESSMMYEHIKERTSL